MTFVDDALPVARPVRSGIAAVKGRSSEDEGGASFRKAFADLGRPNDVNGRMQGKAGDTPAAADEREAIAEKPFGDASETPASGKTTLGKTVPEASPAASAKTQDRISPDDAPKLRASLKTAIEHPSSPQTPADAARPSASAILSASLALKAVETEGVAEPVPQAPTSNPQALDVVENAKVGANVVAFKLKDATADGVPIAPGLSGSKASRVAVSNTAGTVPSKFAAAAKDVVEEPAAAVATPRAASAGSLRKAVETSSGAVSDDILNAETGGQQTAGPQTAGQSDIRDLMAILGPRQTTLSEDTPAKGLETPSDGNAKTGKISGGMPASHLGQPDTSTAEATMPPAQNDAVDQVFRLARADGHLAAASTRADTDTAKAVSAGDQTAAKAETVTVLDARRYLGIAPTLSAQLPMTANSQSVAAVIAGSGDATQLNASLSAGQPGAAGKVVNTLKIQMHPIDLGMVTATLRLKDDELQIDLRVRSGEAYRQLSGDQDAMIQSLRAQGFQVDQVNVVFTPGDSGAGDDAAQQPQGNQQQASQNGRDAQGGLASGNNGDRQRDGGTGQQRADDRRTSNDGMRETSPAAQPGLSDDIYL